ncbi:MAG: hypothetical protein FWC40_09655 [Proteobacteria bacterium]|nr:hypothetical protein [Pseudomonadota bacterium]
MRIVLALLLLLCAFCGQALAQDKPSGALDFGLNFHYSMGDRSVLGVHARAMAVDRVPGTLVGRFGELYGSIGIGLKGDLVSYSAGVKLGLGLGTDYLVLFVASGLMCDGYKSVKEDSKKHNVPPGLGLPLLIGMWIDPMPGLYVYMMAEPSWAFWGDGRGTTPYLPFSFARELRLRGGIGFDVSELHIRLDYTFHQVNPHAWHVISVGFGFSSRAMANLGAPKH